MIRLTFIDKSNSAVEKAIRTRGDAIQKALIAKLTFYLLKLQRKIQTEKLSGQVLHQRSGKLINSIRTEGARIEGGKLVGSVQGAGGEAWYGAVHEFGGTRAYPIKPVNKKALAFFPSGSAGLLISKPDLRKLYSGPMSARSLRPTKYNAFSGLGGVVVKSVMHPPMPKRPFMAPALEEMAAEIVKGLQDTLNKA